MSSSTSRLSLLEPAGSDAPSELRLAITNNATTLDNAVTITQGTFVSRPAATAVPVNTMYYATDVAAYFITNGTVWTYLATSANSTPVGTVQQFAGSSVPSDPDGVTRWQVCDGSAISRTTYAALFTAIGTTWGPGDGSTTFNKPDLRGRSPVGAGSGSGLTSRTLAQSGGEEAHTLVVAETPQHVHDFATATVLNLSGGFSVVGAGGQGIGTQTETGGIVTGGGLGGSHNNMQPYAVVNHIIKVL